MKEVVKSFKKKEKGIMVIAGNITPIDVISHIPILCEENDIPYVYVPAKEELGKHQPALGCAFGGRGAPLVCCARTSSCCACVVRDSVKKPDLGCASFPFLCCSVSFLWPRPVRARMCAELTA